MFKSAAKTLQWRLPHCSNRRAGWCKPTRSDRATGLSTQVRGQNVESGKHVLSTFKEAINIAGTWNVNMSVVKIPVWWVGQNPESCGRSGKCICVRNWQSPEMSRGNRMWGCELSYIIYVRFHNLVWYVDMFHWWHGPTPGPAFGAPKKRSRFTTRSSFWGTPSPNAIASTMGALARSMWNSPSHKAAMQGRQRSRSRLRIEITAQRESLEWNSLCAFSFRILLKCKLRFFQWTHSRKDFLLKSSLEYPCYSFWIPVLFLSNLGA